MVRGSKSTLRSSPMAQRPIMPKDYGILDESAGSGLLAWSHVTDRLAASRNYWVHTTRRDGRPHVKPVWGLWFEDGFYFSTHPNSVAGQSLQANPSIVVHLESGDDVAMLEGRAERVTDHAFLSKLDEAYFAKYSSHLVSGEGGVVYTVHHHTAFAWFERDFVGSATKYVF